jgi:Zn-dependent alcohol dehydrogenase
MRAALCTEFNAPLVIEEVELRDPGPGEVSVRLAACAVCHSDVAYAQGAWGGPLPAVYGHEAAGVVEDVGPGVRAVAPGDHVVVTLIRSCGRCPRCVRGEPALCSASFPLTEVSPLRAKDGTVIHQGLRTGAFAERVTVDLSQVVPIPRDIDLEVACLLACGVITGLGAVTRTAAMPAGASAVVIGCGGVGLNVIQGAALVGGLPIIAVDIVASKLAAARDFGATHAVNAAADDVSAAISAATSGEGPDYIFVTAGSKEAMQQGIDLMPRGGTLVVIGMPPSGTMVGIDPEAIADRSLRILGSKVGGVRPQIDIPKLVDLYLHGRIKLDQLISGRHPLENINEAFAAAESGGALRPLITY